MRIVENGDDGASCAIALTFEVPVCVNTSHTTCHIAADFVTPHAKETLEVL